MNLIRSALLVLGLLAGPVLANEPAPVYELGIDGLSCPFCAYGIEKELTSLAGVEQLGIDITEGLVPVHMAEGAVLDEAMARKATEDAGFSLRSFEEISGE